MMRRQKDLLVLRCPCAAALVASARFVWGMAPYYSVVRQWCRPVRRVSTSGVCCVVWSPVLVSRPSRLRSDLCVHECSALAFVIRSVIRNALCSCRTATRHRTRWAETRNIVPNKTGNSQSPLRRLSRVGVPDAVTAPVLNGAVSVITGSWGLCCARTSLRSILYKVQACGPSGRVRSALRLPPWA